MTFPQSGLSFTDSRSNLEMLVFVKEGKPENREKNPRSKDEINNKLSPHMIPGPGVEPGSHWWEASVVTTVPSLLLNSLIILFQVGLCSYSFGLDHDHEGSNPCPGGHVMADVLPSGVNAMRWTTCSQEKLQAFLRYSFYKLLFYSS